VTVLIRAQPGQPAEKISTHAEKNSLVFCGEPYLSGSLLLQNKTHPDIGFSY
jgi:hypothetical protein